MIKEVRSHKPVWGEGSYIAESADLIGDVKLGKNCSVWFQTVIRGDVMPIEIGEESNIQDQVMIHGTFNKAATKIGQRVSVGHKSMLHGCEIADECLVGMSTTIMDNVKVAPRNLIAAGSLLTEGSEFTQEGMLILGSPAKVKRKLTQSELEFLGQSAKNYLKYKSWYQTNEGDK